MQATPSGWRLLLEAGFRAAAGFKMLCGGEALPRDLADRLLQGSGELWNMYGPTETTIWSSCARVSVGSDPVTVGRPIANTQFYVLDVNREAVPYGVPGELYIGGDGVARGYYKREELNVEKFIANPFKPGRMYRTGDAARWLHSGHVQILGRIDHQIKLRGFRIEAGEIESLLVSHAGVSAAAVLLREDRPGAKRLVAYYVAPASTAPTAEKLADTLSVLVPDYMVPSEWVRMDALPLNPNGKLDKSALPVPDAGLGLQQEFIAPSTPTEATLTQIFAEVLRLERIGITDDLLKLGTDSIQLFQITARANRAGFKISARQLLQLRTAAALAALIDSEGAASSAPLPSLGDAPPGPPTLPTLGQFQRSRRAGSNARR
jgi:aryl carrier-like protein